MDDDDDRISDLPDHILGYILSFLPTKHAVATAVLSSRWNTEDLIAAIPNLDFNDYLTGPKQRDITRERYDRFIAFVNRVLEMHRRSNVTKCQFHFCLPYGESLVSAWICAVLRLNVQKLDISIPMRELRNLPPDIFLCRTLVVLKIRHNFIMQVPSRGVSLPNLKVLCLERVKFTDDDSFCRVFSNCPVLEDLTLLDCPMENIQNFDISLMWLKSLILVRCKYHKIVFDTPNLEFFKYIDALDRVGGYTVNNMNSLVNAHLDLGGYWRLSQQDRFVIAQDVAKLVNAVYNVRCLYLSGPTLEDLEYSGSLLPTFHNLTQLELGLGLNLNGWLLLPNLLESSPSLEILVFPEGFRDYTEEITEFHYPLPEHVPTCLSQHLREIEIKDFGGEEDELKLVEYFLNNGEVLTKMTVKFFWDSERISSTRISSTGERIMMFPRCSETCQIVVCA